MSERERVEISVTSPRQCLSRDDMVTIRVGAETATLTAGEWSALIRAPRKARVEANPA